MLLNNSRTSRHPKSKERLAGQSVGSGASASAASSASVSLRVSDAVSNGDGLGSSSNTIFPLSLPLNFSISASVRITARTGCPETGPAVPGDHGRAKPIKGVYCGSFKCALNFVHDQPRPNGPHFSSLAPDSPHSCILRTAHSAAACNPGDPVRSRAIDVGQIKCILHNLRILERFSLDPVHHI